jgi:hypothetical protein
VGADVFTEDVHAAAGDGGKAVYHANDRGLPRSVRPQQPEENAAFHRETDIVYGREIAEAFDQVLSFDNCL